MTLSLRGTLAGGYDRLVSVNGTLFTGLFFLLAAATEAVLGGIRMQVAVPGPLEEFIAVSPVDLSLAAPLWLLGTGLFALVVLSLATTIVLLRLFLRGERDSVPVAVYDALVPATWRLAVAGVIVFVLVMAGSIVLVVPGLFILVSLLFYAVLIADGESIIDSLRGSWALARGRRLRLFALMVALVVLNVGLEAFAYVVPSAMIGLLVGAAGTVYALAVTVEAYGRIRGDGA